MPTRRRAASVRLSNGPTVPRTALSAVRTALSAVREPLKNYALHFSPREKEKISATFNRLHCILVFGNIYINNINL